MTPEENWSDFRRSYWIGYSVNGGDSHNSKHLNTLTDECDDNIYSSSFAEPVRKLSIHAHMIFMKAIIMHSNALKQYTHALDRLLTAIHLHTRLCVSETFVSLCGILG